MTHDHCHPAAQAGELEAEREAGRRAAGADRDDDVGRLGQRAGLDLGGDLQRRLDVTERPDRGGAARRQ